MTDSGTGNSSGSTNNNMYQQRQNFDDVNAPHHKARNMTVTMNRFVASFTMLILLIHTDLIAQIPWQKCFFSSSNGNLGTSLSNDMTDIRPTTRHTTSFSYVTDQLTSASSIPPQFSSPNSARCVFITLAVNFPFLHCIRIKLYSYIIIIVQYMIFLKSHFTNRASFLRFANIQLYVPSRLHFYHTKL